MTDSRESVDIGRGEVELTKMSSEGDWTIHDCPHCGRCVTYSRKAASSKEAYRDLTAELAEANATIARQQRQIERKDAALCTIADIGEGSTTANSLQHVAKIAHVAIAYTGEST